MTTKRSEKKHRRRKSRWMFFFCAVGFLCGWSNRAFSEEANQGFPAGSARPTLVQAVMCEAVRDYAPQNQGVVFSTGIGKVICYTGFDPVPQKAVIYHNWFHRGQLSSKHRLTLNPPRWSSYTSIQLREEDRGPWRVEITDGAGEVLKVLRFSITE